MMFIDCQIKIYYFLEYIEMFIDYVNNIFYFFLICYVEYSSGLGKEYIKVRI